jgi:hypothetical protein
MALAMAPAERPFAPRFRTKSPHRKDGKEVPLSEVAPYVSRLEFRPVHASGFTASASALAPASPIPLPPPVIQAILPDKVPTEFILPQMSCSVRAMISSCAALSISAKYAE